MKYHIACVKYTDPDQPALKNVVFWHCRINLTNFTDLHLTVRIHQVVVHLSGKILLSSQATDIPKGSIPKLDSFLKLEISEQIKNLTSISSGKMIDYPS